MKPETKKWIGLLLTVTAGALLASYIKHGLDHFVFKIGTNLTTAASSAATTAGTTATK